MQESVANLELETVKQRFRLEVRHFFTAWQAPKMRVVWLTKLYRHQVLYRQKVTTGGDDKIFWCTPEV
jgi:hypothetical protein